MKSTGALSTLASIAPAKPPAGGVNIPCLERMALPVVILLGALLFLLNLGGYPIYTKGESREAVTIFDIVHGGGIILPMRAGVEIPSKPLLMHWLAALCALIGGINPWTVRLPSALCAIGGMAACFIYLRRLFDWRVGLLAAVMLGTSAQYVQAGGGARVDMTLTFFLEIAFFEFILLAEGLRRQPWMLYGAIALAVLTKGPIGIALPALVAGIWIVYYRRWGLLSRLKLWRGALIVGVLGGGWYVAAIATGGAAFVHKQLLGENLYRLIHHAGVHEPHAHPFYYEDAALLVGFMPWTLLAIPAALQFSHSPQKIDSRVGYLLIWAIAVLLFYNLPQSKRGIYLLAMYPALCGLITLPIGDAIFWPGRIKRLVAAFTWAAGVIMLAAGLVLSVALIVLFQDPQLIDMEFIHLGVVALNLPNELRMAAEHWMLLVPLLPAALLIAGLWMLLPPRRLSKIVTGFAAATLAAVLAVNLVIQPAIARTLTLKNFAGQVHSIAAGRITGFFGNLDYNFAFYSGRDLTLTTPLDPNGPVLLVSPEDDWKLVPPRLSARYRVLLRSHPTELDGSGRMLLLERIVD